MIVSNVVKGYRILNLMLALQNDHNVHLNQENLSYLMRAFRSCLLYIIYSLTVTILTLTVTIP